MRRRLALVPADDRNGIGVRARRDGHPQNLAKKLSRKTFKT